MSGRPTSAPAFPPTQAGRPEDTLCQPAFCDAAELIHPREEGCWLWDPFPS